MSEPVFIEPLVQRESGDCGIACLVMLTGKSYPEVCTAAPHNAFKKGMQNREVIATAAKLGLRLVQHHRARINWSEDVGILTLLPTPAYNGTTKRDEHYVLLLEGLIYDGYNGRLWFEVETYLAHERYRVGTLLRRE